MLPSAYSEGKILTHYTAFTGRCVCQVPWSQALRCPGGLSQGQEEAHFPSRKQKPDATSKDPFLSNSKNLFSKPHQILWAPGHTAEATCQHHQRIRSEGVWFISSKFVSFSSEISQKSQQGGLHRLFQAKQFGGYEMKYSLRQKSNLHCFSHQVPINLTSIFSV